MDAEKIKNHIKHLQQEHDELDVQLAEQQKHYGEDRLVTMIKKRNNCMSNTRQQNSLVY